MLIFSLKIRKSRLKLKMYLESALVDGEGFLKMERNEEKNNEKEKVFKSC